MTTKHFRITVGLVLSAIACVPVLGGQVLRKAEPLKILTPTYVPCKVRQELLQQGPPKGQLTITNDTRRGIPKGTTIYWKVGVNKGSFILPKDLRPAAPFSTAIQMSSAVADSVKAVAWYYK